ncbi:sucrose nonfermenting 4-like protein isoform X2 [Magnolia sinica]|uniref:sucrose nonfermenting 4-like protein isoform X2 n=1 Tax=Magnolia sinica TaxID=86752 RepID=UPI002659FA03|nr:sucrose nonfermenting 4-like protein isoform X2 [Magnolia sinica]
MVTTRFSWSYGGRDVFLSGSFTGWSKHVPMTLVEGSSTVFLAICNLAPGHHKYKFLVDGVWRHDEQQPFFTDEYGIVNNFIFVREPEVVSSVLRPVASIIQPHMEVDNGAYQHAASSSGGMHRELMARFPDADINVSRGRISVLLSSYTAYELLPESGKGLAVVPIWDDSRRQFSGMLTASDFILILRELHNNGSMLTNEELEVHSISAWKEEKLRLNGQPDGPAQPFRRPLIQAGPHESLKDVALRILQNKISVVPIIHSPMHDGSCPQLLHLACLPGILKYICRHFRHSPGSVPLLQQPIFAIPLGTWAAEMGVASRRQLIVLRPSAPLSSALNLLMEAQVSSIPIVDDNGSLLDVYSRSDITALARGGAYAHISLDQTSMQNVLQLGYEANIVINGPRRCHTCLRTDTLHEIMEQLSDPAVRRLIVIEAGSNRVQGIISLRDIFNFLLG